LDGSSGDISNQLNGLEDSLNDETLSLDAESISLNNSGPIDNVDGVRSGIGSNGQSGSDGDILKVVALGLVVLSGNGDITSDDQSVCNSGRLAKSVSWGQDVSIHSIGSIDGSSRVDDIVDDSLDDGREFTSLDGDVTGSGDVDDPSGCEGAVIEGIPIDLGEGSSIDNDVIQEIGGIIASDEESISISKFRLGVDGQLRQFGLDSNIVIAGSLEGLINIRKVSKGWDVCAGSSSEVALDVQIGSIRMERSR